MEIRPVAYIHTDFPTKFGLPRQAGLVEGLKGEIDDPVTADSTGGQQP